MTPQERKVMELALKALGENVVAMRGLYGLRDFTTTLKAFKALEEALAQPEQEPWLLETTQTLAKHMAREFYPEVTQWECLDNLAGVISQIDNMTTGLMRKPEQEPVAWMYESVCGNDFATRHKPPDYGKNIRPLYTTPPQRTWVGLTDEEVKKIAYNTAERKVAKDIEAKLKEKNDC